MIPVSEPLITEDEVTRVMDCLRSGWISSSGRYLEQFEEKWASYCGMSYGIAVSNGSVALDIAVALLDLKQGDEVIMPAFTIISPAQAVIRAGGVPVLVDSNIYNWQMDVAQIEGKITERTRAILVVHIYGHPADMDRILELARKYGLTVIEDAAEVHGAEYKGKKCGGIGDISTFSFYANKLVTTGEGGMVLVRSEKHAIRAKGLRNLCFQPQQRFLHEELGYNFRMTNIQAAIGIGQIERMETIVAKKRRIAAEYTKRLGSVPHISLPVEEPWALNVYWVYGILLDEVVDTMALTKDLSERGVETRPFFLGMHEQPVFQKMGLFKNEKYPVAEKMARKGFYIPSGLTITDEEIEKVVEAIVGAIQ